MQGDNYVLNGNKIFTTNGGEADQYLVIARSTKEEGARGLSGFIVEKGNEGLSFGRKERKMGFRACSTRELKDYPVERYMRDAKIGQIFDGTNEIQRTIIGKYLLGSSA